MSDSFKVPQPDGTEVEFARAGAAGPGRTYEAADAVLRTASRLFAVWNGRLVMTGHIGLTTGGPAEPECRCVSPALHEPGCAWMAWRGKCR